MSNYVVIKYWRYTDKSVIFEQNKRIDELIEEYDKNIGEISAIEKIEIFELEDDVVGVKQYHIKRVGGNEFKRWYNLEFDTNEEAKQ